MAVNIHRVLFPTDFSDAAQDALLHAKLVVERFGSELHMLHVVPNLTMPLPESSFAMTEAEQNSYLERAKLRLPDEVGSQWMREHHTICSVSVGNPVEQIMVYSNANQIDLIVLGTHGMTSLSRLLLGSVAEKLIRLAHCPVMTVHPTVVREVNDRWRETHQRNSN